MLIYLGGFGGGRRGGGGGWVGGGGGVQVELWSGMILKDISLQFPYSLYTSKDDEDSQEEQQPSPDPVVKEEPVSPDRELHLPSPDREAHLPSPDRELQQPSADTYSGSQHSMDEDSPTSLPPDAHSNSLSPFSLGVSTAR